MAALTADQILQVALQAGFPLDTATKMVAIALKESGGDPTAHNSTPPDDSYGLWQINMFAGVYNGRDYSGQAAQRMAAFGLSSPSDLFDPAVNAAAAYSIWGGNDASLAANWYIDRGADATRYQSYLPAAQLAASRFAAASGSPTGGGGGTATGQQSFSPGRSGAPLPRPGSTSAPGGLGSLPLPSSPSGSAPGSSPSNSSTSKWWAILHGVGVVGWPILVHFFPWLSVPVAIAAPAIHGAMPAAFPQLFARKK